MVQVNFGCLSSIVVDTPNTYLYFVLGGGKAIRYGIGVGRDGSLRAHPHRHQDRGAADGSSSRRAGELAPKPVAPSREEIFAPSLH